MKRNNLSKRILSVVMVCVMLLGYFPVSIWAVETSTDIKAIEKPTGISIVEDYDDYIGDNWLEKLGLPTEVTVTLANDSTVQAPVTWDVSSLDTRTTGYYSIPGEVTLPAGATNSQNLKAVITVQVQRAKNLLVNGDFEKGYNSWDWAWSVASVAESDTNKVLEIKRKVGQTIYTGMQSVALRKSLANAQALANEINKLGVGQYYAGIKAKSAAVSAENIAARDDLSVAFTFMCDESSMLSYFGQSKAAINTADWTTISAVFDITKSYTSVSPLVYLYAKTSNTAGAACYIDNFELIALNVPLKVEPANIAQIKTEVLSRSVVLNYPDYVGEGWKDALGLPSSVEVLTDTGATASVDVTWSYAGLDFTKYGKYTLVGTLDDSSFPNPNGLTVQMNVYVGKSKNLIVNGDFENGYNNWIRNWTMVSIDESDINKLLMIKREIGQTIYTGTQSGAFSKNTADATALAAQINDVGLGQYMLRISGKSAASKADGIALRSDLSMAIQMYCMDSTGTGSWVGYTKAALNSTDWTVATSVFDIDKSYTYVSPIFCLSAAVSDTAGAACYIDNYELIPLNVSIPKDKEPEDVAEIITEVPVRAVVENYDKYMGANWKTKLGLPETVEVRTVSGKTASVGVEWDYTSLNIKKPGKYTLIGTLDNSAFPNPKELYVTQIIHIIEYKNLLPNPSFEGSTTGWSLPGVDPKCGVVKNPVKDGLYAADTGAWPTTAKRTSFAFTVSTDANTIGNAVSELGGGQYYYSIWSQYSGKTLPDGMQTDTWLLHQTADEEGNLSDLVITKSELVDMSNKTYVQAGGTVELSADTAWVQLAAYAVARNSGEIGTAMYVDHAELVPLNVIIEQHEGQMVQVETVIPDRQIVQNYPDYIGPGYTTADLMLPTSVFVRSSLGESVKVGIKWDYSNLDLTKTGYYTLYGVLEDMKLANPDALTVKQKIKVAAKSNLLTNGSFEDDNKGWDCNSKVTMVLGNADPVRTGGLSMRIDVGRLDGVNYNRIQAFYNSASRATLGKRISSTGAGRYYASAWAQGTESTNDMQFNLWVWQYTMSRGDSGSATVSPMKKLSTTQFTQMSVIMDFPDDIYAAFLDLNMHGTAQQMRLSTFYLEDFELLPLNVEIANATDIISCKDPADIYVHEGTSIEGLKLPEELEVVIKSGQRFKLGVTWDLSNFDANKVGVYNIIGELNLENKYRNVLSFVPTVTITVRAKGEDLRQTIYISTSGSEDNDGLSPENPKKDVKKIATYLAQGYNVRLKRGDVWYLSSGFTFNHLYGTEDAPLVLGAYGSGDQLPRLAFMHKIENSEWKLVDAKRNVYAADVSYLKVRDGVRVHRCFVNDVSYTYRVRSNYASLKPGQACDYGGKLYIRMEEGKAPSNVEITQAENGAPFRIKDVSYMNIEYIHIKGTLGVATLIYVDAPSEYLKFRHCNITHTFYYVLSMDSINEQIHNKPEISYCYIDANFNEEEGFWVDPSNQHPRLWSVSITEGITLRGGVESAWIHHNHMRNLSHIFIGIEAIGGNLNYNTTGVRNTIIEDNLLEAGTVMYARPFSLNGCYNSAGVQMVRDNIIRRNRCYEMSSSIHFFGENNLVYSNVFSYYRTTFMEDGTLFQGKGAIGSVFDSTVYSDRVSIGNILVNNTFYNVGSVLTIVDNAGVVHDNIYANNLAVNWVDDVPAYPGVIDDKGIGFNNMLNNAFYALDGKTNHFCVDGILYTAEDANNSVAGYSGNISGKPMFLTADLNMNDKYSRQEFDLSGESPFRYAGVSLYNPVYRNYPAWERLMEDYTDINGVVYLAESPSIGAYSFSEKIKGDVAEVGKLEDILARPGATFDQLNLPDAVPATNDQGIDVMLLADWNAASFDSSKPGTVTVTAALRNGPHTELNINGKVATVNVNIKQKLKLLTITTTVKNATVLYGTSLEDAIKQLPQAFDVIEEAGFQEALPVTWTCSDYNPTKPGVYTFKCILPEDMITNVEDFHIEVEVRVLHEIGRGMELLINADFTDGASASPWKVGWGNGSIKITTDPKYLLPGEAASVIVSGTSRYSSVQQDVTGQLRLMGDGKYLFRVYMRTYELGVTIDSSVPCLQIEGPKAHLLLSRTMSNIGNDWVEYNTVMDVEDTAQAQIITFHTSTYKSKEDVEDGSKAFVIAGCSLIYLGDTDVEVEATLDSIGLEWNAIKGENSLDMKNVTSDLKLPTAIGMGSKIKWTSSDESVISNDGKVTMGRVPKTVQLTATITYNGIETVKKFTVTVPRDPSLPTFSGSLSGSQAVKIGDEFKVTISLAGEKATYFNAYRFTLSFNSSKLEYVSCSDAGSTVEVEGGRITISGIGTERPITDTITLTFKAKKSGITEVKLVKVEMDLDPNASLDTLPTMTVTEGAAMIDVQKIEEDVEAPVAEQDDSGVIWIIIGLVAAALICGGVITVIVIKKKKQTPPTES